MSKSIYDTYIIYQTTNLVNGKIYIGVHNGHNDEYFGSGNILKRALKRYGSENFVRTTLFSNLTKDEAYLKEAEIVDEHFVSRKDTYNLKCGGIGGWDHVNVPEVRKEIVERTREVWRNNMKRFNDAPKEEIQRRCKKAVETKRRKYGKVPSGSMSEDRRKQHSKRMRERNLGRHWYINPMTKEMVMCYPGTEPVDFISSTKYKNSTKNRDCPNYGRHWYNDGERNFFLFPDHPQSKLLTLGRLVKSKSFKLV